MSFGRRTYDLLRGYVNSEWDRMHEIELTDAERELAEAIAKPSPRKTSAPRSEPVAEAVVADKEDRARRILGLDANAPFEEVRHCFEKLNRRSDPANFPEGSEERSRAADIQVRVQWAYQVLTENVDVTEKRFRSLEIER